MKNILTFLLLLFILSCNSTATKKLVIAEKFDVQVILLAGQSNMAGAGNYNALEGDLKTRIEKAGERILLTVDGDEPRPLSYRYSEYQENKRGFGNVFGPELFLGLTMAEQYADQSFLFIKRAQGGTALQGAWNPEWTAEKAAAVEKEGFKRDLQLYNEHHQQIRTQLNALEREGKSYNIAGLFWLQGENDAAKEIAARNYEANLKKLIEGYRTAFNVPNLSFVMGQINSSYGRFKEGPEMVRNAMLTVAEEDNRVEVVTTTMDVSFADFPKHDDNVHYNHIGQMRLGIAFAEKWIALNHLK